MECNEKYSWSNCQRLHCGGGTNFNLTAFRAEYNILIARQLLATGSEAIS